MSKRCVGFAMSLSAIGLPVHLPHAHGSLRSNAPPMQVKKGGPNVLEEPGNEKRSLFLCYPDDFEGETESLGVRCLHSFEGDVVRGFYVTGVGGWTAFARSSRLLRIVS